MQDYINIELDNQRNQLIRVSDNSVAGFANLLTASDVHLNVHCWLQIELVLTAATFAVAIIGSIAGIFGMNLNNNHEDSHTLFLVVRVLCVLSTCSSLESMPGRHDIYGWTASSLFLNYLNDVVI